MSWRWRDPVAAGLLCVLAEAQVAGHPWVSVVLGLGYLLVGVAGARPELTLVALALLLLVDATAGGVLVGGVAAVLALGWVAFLAGRRQPPPARALAGVVVVTGLSVVADQVYSPGAFAPANDVVFYGVMLVLPGLVGWSIGSRSAQLAELTARTEELERRREAAVRFARAEEAARVEREVDRALTDRLRAIIGDIDRVHDLVGQRAADVPAGLAQVEATAREALGDLREVLGVLRPGALPGDPSPSPSTSVAPGPPERSAHPDRLDALLLIAVVPLAIETSLSGRRGPAWLNVAAALVQGLALVHARRRPLSGTALLLLAAGVQTAVLTPLPPTISWLLPGVLVVFLLARQLPARRAAAGLALAALGMYGAVLVTPAAHRGADSLVPDLVVGALSFWAGRTLRARDRRVGELHLIAAELSRRTAQEARLGALERRAAMARDLHDLGAHILTVVCLQCSAARATWEGDRSSAIGAVEVLRELAADSLTSLRTSLGQLSSPSEEPVDTALDATSLDLLTGLGRVLGLDVTVSVTGTPQPLPTDVAHAAFGVVQESLTNTARHAGHSDVDIRLTYRARCLEVTVADTGPLRTEQTQPAVLGSGSGLRGMRERVLACRGELTSGPGEDGRGFTVRALLPLVVAS